MRLASGLAVAGGMLHERPKISDVAQNWLHNRDSLFGRVTSGRISWAQFEGLERGEMLPIPFPGILSSVLSMGRNLSIKALSFQVDG